MSEIQLNLELEGQDASLDTLYSLQEWIQQDQISGLKQIETGTGDAPAEKMGVDLTTILEVVLSSAAVRRLAQSLHVWIKATRPEVTIKIKLNDTQSIEINSKNLPDQQAFVSQVISQVKRLEPGD